MNAQRAMEILRAIDPDTKLVVSEPPNNPFYINSEREPRVGDIVELRSHYTNNTFRYVYTETVRKVGMNNQYETRWVSLSYGSADTGPVNAAVADRKLLSSIPE